MKRLEQAWNEEYIKHGLQSKPSFEAGYRAALKDFQIYYDKKNSKKYLDELLEYPWTKDFADEEVSE